MFAKVFTQIFDSSIVEKPDVRFTFTDLLTLCDINGVVDMTHEAIARRTNRPLELIKSTIAELEGPDPRSRTKDFAGARLKRLDKHRDWGWLIVNYGKFRQIASDEQRREKTKARTQRWRDRDATVTHGDAGDAMQRQKQRERKKQTQRKEEMPLFPPSPSDAELIYAAYPKKVGRPDALKAITKAISKFGAPLLLEKTKAFNATRAGNLSFVPNPSTWFNQERFNDDPSTWRPSDNGKAPPRIPDKRENIQVPIQRL